MSFFMLFLLGGIESKGAEMLSAQEVIQKLDLKPLPEEGGYYRETYRSSDLKLPAKAVGLTVDGDRNLSTAIYYLVSEESFSALHRITSDEIFHFYAGDPVEMVQLDEDGNLEVLTIGSDIMTGQTPQVVVPKGVWQGLKLKEGGKWALMGTTVSPGFEFQDFEVASREKLIQIYPQHQDYITKFTRGGESSVSE